MYRTVQILSNMKENIYVDNIKKNSFKTSWYTIAYLLFVINIAAANGTCLCDYSGQLFQKKQKVSKLAWEGYNNVPQWYGIAYIEWWSIV